MELESEFTRYREVGGLNSHASQALWRMPHSRCGRSWARVEQLVERFLEDGRVARSPSTEKLTGVLLFGASLSASLGVL